METLVTELAELICTGCAEYDDCEWGRGKCGAVRDEARMILNAGYRKVEEAKWTKDPAQVRDDGEIYDYCCSKCGFGAIADSYGNCTVFTKYCHGCGAVMSIGD